MSSASPAGGRPSPVKKPRRVKRRRLKRRRRSSLWGWFVLALGVLVAALWPRAEENRNSRHSQKRRERHRRRSGGESGRWTGGSEDRDRGEAKAREIGRLPENAAVSWIAGPSGSLRICEKNPSGQVHVVFVHGLGGCLEQWAEVLHYTGPKIHAVALDLPGHGGSDPPMDDDVSISALAASLGATIDGLGLRRVVLVAHSLGGTVAVDYSGRHPERVAGLFLVDSNGDLSRMSEEEKKQLRNSLATDAGKELTWHFRQILMGSSAAVTERVLADLEQVPDGVLAGALSDALNHQTLDALERYDGPVRAVISDFNDTPISLHRLRPDLPFQSLMPAGHWLMLDRPNDVWEALVDFLEDLHQHQP